ncbi:hypothetical protein V8C37DRAFT_372137 [Trichoderma ceciliae]
MGDITAQSAFIFFKQLTPMTRGLAASRARKRSLLVAETGVGVESSRVESKPCRVRVTKDTPPPPRTSAPSAAKPNQSIPAATRKSKKSAAPWSWRWDHSNPEQLFLVVVLSSICRHPSQALASVRRDRRLGIARLWLRGINLNHRSGACLVLGCKMSFGIHPSRGWRRFRREGKKNLFVFVLFWVLLPFARARYQYIRDD